MLKITPISSALAALIIASALSGCGGGNVEPVSAPTSVSNAQTATEAATASAEAMAAAEAAKAAQESAAAEAATAAKGASDARAAAEAKAKAAVAAKAAAAAQAPVAKPAPAPAPAPKPAPAPAAAKTYTNCTAMHVDYKGGVARPGAVDHRASGHANYAPVYNTSLYNANKGSDRDGDGISCEA